MPRFVTRRAAFQPPNSTYIPQPLHTYAPRAHIQTGTYGGHLELSAFAHLKHKNVKVIQPGLVYVIEWGAGAPFPSSPRASTTTNSNANPATNSSPYDGGGKSENGPADTIYVA
jgi:hypothetical protein